MALGFCFPRRPASAPATAPSVEARRFLFFRTIIAWCRGKIPDGRSSLLRLARTEPRLCRSAVCTPDPAAFFSELTWWTSDEPVRTLLACSRSLIRASMGFRSSGNSWKAAMTTARGKEKALTTPRARTVAVRRAVEPTSTDSPIKLPSLTSPTLTPPTSTSALPRWMMMAKSPSSPSLRIAMPSKYIFFSKPCTNKSQNLGSLSLKKRLKISLKITISFSAGPSSLTYGVPPSSSDSSLLAGFTNKFWNCSKLSLAAARNATSSSANLWNNECSRTELISKKVQKVTQRVV
mmetsp:Transcript_121349/g.387882  ORF Transcript_121349/g.387882 Transcript_121349/m.387882 type:complete len:292 (+) Transcript_121349:585-1460(+)